MWRSWRSVSGSLAGALRDARWLNADRGVGYTRLLGAVTLIGAVAWVALARGGLDRLGKPLGTDFLSFWAASRLALEGHAAAVYNPAIHAAAERAAFGGADVGYAAFFYPPVYLLICLPLALLPYMASLPVWLGVTGLAYWRVVRAWLDSRVGVVAILAFPAVLLTVGHGQNAFLTSALFGAGALALGKRPGLAGVCFGALIFKPHLGILIPLALIAAGQWRAIASAAGTAVVFAAASLLAFGPEAWRGFFAISPLARASLETELVGSEKMQSVFAAIRLAGGTVSLGYAAQIVVGLAAAIAVAAVARRRRSGAAMGATLVCGTLLASPFLLDYDLALAAIPLAWLVSMGLRDGFAPWEKITLALAYVLPLVSRVIAMKFGIACGPFVLGALLIVVARRAWATGRIEAPRPGRGEDAGGAYSGNSAVDAVSMRSCSMRMNSARFRPGGMGGRYW